MNPLYAKLAAGAVVFGVGFSAAWKWQDVKLGELQNEFDGYKVEQQRILNDNNRDAAKRQQETADAWAVAVGVVRSENEREFAAYKRCVAAGRCGAVVRDRVCAAEPQARPDSSDAGAVPPAPGPDETGDDSVPVAARLAAECAETTLQLNLLQADIEKQKGY